MESNLWSDMAPNMEPETEQDADLDWQPPIQLNEEREKDPPGLKCEIHTYDVRYNSKGEKIKLYAGERDALKPPRAPSHDSALVLTRFYDKDRQLERTELEVRSPYIKKALQDVIKTYPGLNFHSKEVMINDIPKCLFHYRNELGLYRIGLIDVNAGEHLDFLLQYIEQVLFEPIWRYYVAVEASLDPAKTGLEFLDLWMVFRPNDLVFLQVLHTDKVMRLASMTRCECLEPSCRRQAWKLCLEHLSYDGQNFGYEERFRDIQPYDGQKSFRQLKIYPLAYHEDKEKITKALIERGKRFVGLQGAHYQEYEGLAEALSPFRMTTAEYGERDFFPLQTTMIKGRVMIDADTFGCKFPTNAIDFDTELESEKCPKEPGGQPNFGDGDFLICDHQIPGFSLSNKLWCFFKVDLLQEPTFNSEAFRSLILPEDQKKMIYSLVNVHTFVQLNFDDFIKGKGKGMIFLLHGEPGTGKTLTAESIADFTKRPLYTISSGELGTDAKSMEQNLSKALELAETWKAIVLIDEADVFLEQRNAHALERNGLVSVFLRLLEYYEGILFLTTNRVGAFDLAFKSRIHLAIKYSPLTISARSKLWKSFITNTYPNADLRWADQNCLDELGAFELNGREIKNAFRTAHALAVSSNEDFSREHIEFALKGIQQFNIDSKAEALEAGGSETELNAERRPWKRRRH